MKNAFGKAVLMVAVSAAALLASCAGGAGKAGSEQSADADIAVDERYVANKEAGEKFLAENKKKTDVITTMSGLQYKILTIGNGEIPAATSTVKVNYKGKLIDGTEFDSSYRYGEPSEFPVNSLIRGWREALQLMPAGSKWILYIPQEMAYGAAGYADLIPPYSALVFEVELLEVLNK